MEKRNKAKMGCGAIMLIVCVLFVIFFVHIYKDLSELEDTFKAIEHSTPIVFKKEKQTIFITTRIFGLGGQHSHTIISNIDHTTHNDILIDREKEIVIDGICCLYYKIQEPETLLVFLPSGSDIEEKENHRQISNINIKIIEVNNSKYNNFRKTHEELGLIFINCPSRAAN